MCSHLELLQPKAINQRKNPVATTPTEKMQRYKAKAMALAAKVEKQTAAAMEIAAGMGVAFIYGYGSQKGQIPPKPMGVDSDLLGGVGLAALGMTNWKYANMLGAAGQALLGHWTVGYGAEVAKKV